MVENGLKTSITGRAIESGAISVEAVDIRDYTTDKHRHVDDAPYGGGADRISHLKQCIRNCCAVF